jgi:hypothetical protein
LGQTYDRLELGHALQTLVECNQAEHKVYEGAARRDVVPQQIKNLLKVVVAVDYWA